VGRKRPSGTVAKTWWRVSGIESGRVPVRPPCRSPRTFLDPAYQITTATGSYTATGTTSGQHRRPESS